MTGFSLIHWLILLVPLVAIVAFLIGVRRGRAGRDDLMSPPRPLDRSSSVRPPAPAGISGPGSLAMPGTTTLPTEVETRVWVELRDGNVINAIKIVRESTGWNLKSSKDFVDDMRRRDPQLR